MRASTAKASRRPHPATLSPLPAAIAWPGAPMAPLRRAATASVVVLALLLAGCQRETGPDPLQLTGKMFVFNYRLAHATYLITLNQTKPLPEGTTITAEFEDPAGGAPLTLERRLFPKLEKVVLESPGITCVRKARRYRVAIRVTGPDGTQLQRLETSLASDVDQSVLPAQPLVVGPLYDRNPEMFMDGKALKHFDMAKCPV